MLAAAETLICSVTLLSFTVCGLLMGSKDPVGLWGSTDAQEGEDVEDNGEEEEVGRGTSRGEAGKADCLAFSIMVVRSLTQTVTINLVLLSESLPLHQV